MGKLSSPWDESSPPVIQDGNVVELLIFTDKVADLSPIRALSELRELHCVFETENSAATRPVAVKWNENSYAENRGWKC